MDKILSIDIKQFNYGDETVLKNIKLSAYKGECLVFTGLSGCGKTTLLRLLNRLIPDIYEGELTGYSCLPLPFRSPSCRFGA